MPWSWVRVSTGTSPKLRKCMGDDTSAAKFEECVRTIIGDDAGDHIDIRYEYNGEWARVLFFWEDAEVKKNVVHDLRAEDVLDLISSDERDALRRRDATEAGP